MFEADARVDVCGIYDTEKWCFDHHQPSFKVNLIKVFSKTHLIKSILNQNFSVNDYHC